MNYNLIAKAYSKIANGNYNEIYNYFNEIEIEINKKDNNTDYYKLFQESEKGNIIDFENDKQAVAFLFFCNKYIDESKITNTSIPLNNNYIATGYKLFLSFNRKINLKQIPKNLAMLFPRLIFIPYKNDQYYIENLYHFSKTRHYTFPIKLCFIPYPKSFKIENIAPNSGEFIQKENKEYDKKIFSSYEQTIKLDYLGIFSCEMVGSSKLEEDIYRLFFDCESIFVNMPSFYLVDEKNVINRLKVNYFQGEIYDTYDLVKKTPFSNEKLTEKLTNKNAKYVLIHIENIGRILFCICKDYLDSEFEELCKFVLPDIIIVSAFTKDYSTFSDVTRNFIVRNYARLVIIGNACSATNESPLVIYQYKKGGKDSRVERIDGSIENCKYCSSKKYCYFDILVNEEDDKLNVKVENKDER